MKIKKHGKLFSGKKEIERTEKFACDNCGCEFSVKEDEYYVDDKYDFMSTSATTYTYIWPPKKILVCSCPECYKICKKTEYQYPSITTCSNTCASVPNTSGSTVTLDSSLNIRDDSTKGTSQ